MKLPEDTQTAVTWGIGTVILIVLCLLIGQPIGLGPLVSDRLAGEVRVIDTVSEEMKVETGLSSLVTRSATTTTAVSYSYD